MASMTTGIAPEVMSHTQLGTRLTSFVDEAGQKPGTPWSPNITSFHMGK
jgi:hypothetical protein